MASVRSPFRNFVKPLIMRCLGPSAYRWFLLRGKIRDIDHRLVEEAEMDLLPKLVGRGDHVLDIGANFAYYSVRLAELCPEGRVIAFEPIPSTFDICRRIIASYGLKNVELHQKGVGAKTEVRRFEVPLQKLGTHSAGQAHMQGRDNSLEGRERYHPFEKHDSFDCEIVDLDSFLEANRKISFIKIDIEGAEYFALQGMKKLLERDCPHLLMEVCPYFLKGFGIDESALETLLATAKYTGFQYDRAEGALREARRPYSDGNYVFIHTSKLSSVEDLILKGGGKERVQKATAIQ